MKHIWLNAEKFKFDDGNIKFMNSICYVCGKSYLEKYQSRDQSWYTRFNCSVKCDKYYERMVKLKLLK